MRRVESPLIGRTYRFGPFRDTVESLGFAMNETFDYHTAAFDYVLHKSKTDVDFYLRLDVDAVRGYIEQPQAEIIARDIRLLRAVYHRGFDYDGDIPREMVAKAEAVLRTLHERLMVEAAFRIA
ncbi:MAG: hypothetical protein HSCHL_1657 [Hydrogenibacillus schlegelii]|uniref:Uncharacterized protein n=1 Tax=Hydrogenibacillus schlegelii TaxID=1484 RepID=A0A2T5GBN8_HYDSH|nr:YugN family protein [Hydrogenibacillus schlegelii]PTQ53592.1 MAG: hypothetical protein HSCHL_1657 [Hydrogenibacillus schlegelii]